MYLPVHVFPTTNSPEERPDMYQIPVTFHRLPIALYVKLHGGLHVCRDPSHINEGYPHTGRWLVLLTSRVESYSGLHQVLTLLAVP